MTDSTPDRATAIRVDDDAAPQIPVEDTGSTVDASDLVDEQTEPLAGGFDQTNGVVDGLEGESDGTAAGDEENRADRDGGVRPIGQQDAFTADHYGEDDGRDPNP